MSSFKIYDLSSSIKEIPNKIENKESEVHNLIQTNLDLFFGIRFVESEYNLNGIYRVDTLGIDQNNVICVIEYKKGSHDAIIVQSLAYLNWVLDHKSQIEKSVKSKFKDIEIDWSDSRIICVANEFNKYDQGAINIVDASVELYKYKFFKSNNLFTLEKYASNFSSKEKKSDRMETQPSDSVSINSESERHNYYHIQGEAVASPELKKLFYKIEEYIFTLSDQIEKHKQKYYTAYKIIKNLFCITFFQDKIKIFLKSDFFKFPPAEGFIRDVTNTSHWGTGNMEITISDEKNLNKVFEIFEDSFRNFSK